MLSSKANLFYKQKAFYSHQPFCIALPSNSFLPSATHSHPAITYCPQKNTAVLLIFALNPHAVTPEPRTDSKPFRRHLCEKPVSARAVGSISKSIPDRALNRPRESRGSQPSACFCVTFCTPQKVTKNVPSQGVPRFCEPRISAHKRQIRTNPIKSFCLLWRLFPCFLHRKKQKKRRLKAPCFRTAFCFVRLA